MKNNVLILLIIAALLAPGCISPAPDAAFEPVSTQIETHQEETQESQEKTKSPLATEAPLPEVIWQPGRTGPAGACPRV
jgi:PBP1b-binding outer membrane lipoprotein LpoB